MVYQELLDQCPHISTEKMSYEEWLIKRRAEIGGSDAGSIMLLNRKYGSPLTVYLQKKGMEKETEASPAAKRGKLLEPLIRDWFAAEYPDAVVEKVPYMFTAPGEYAALAPREGKIIVPPFMMANIDGVIFTKQPINMSGDQCIGLGGLEIKSSRDGYDFTNDTVPDSYYAQVQHYMAVLNLGWFIISAAILTTEEIKNYLIPRNDEFIYELIQAETKFWNDYVITDTWPAPVGIENEIDMINALFEGGSTLVLGEEEKELCREYLEASARFKESKATKDRISATIRKILVQKQSKNGEKKISAMAGKYSISLTFFDRHDVDTEALKKAGLYEKFVNVSESGQLRITEKKGA
jgi:predicted phage-related endonuclease